jgi:cell division protein FtsN
LSMALKKIAALFVGVLGLLTYLDVQLGPMLAGLVIAFIAFALLLAYQSAEQKKKSVELRGKAVPSESVLHAPRPADKPTNLGARPRMPFSEAHATSRSRLNIVNNQPLRKFE